MYTRKGEAVCELGCNWIVIAYQLFVRWVLFFMFYDYEKDYSFGSLCAITPPYWLFGAKCAAICGDEIQ